jgi:2-amino-4-hydroxy-6-hydroxymethyldihydropteridine diphosphokinase
LRQIKELETDMGRDFTTTRNDGARPIDIDILLYGSVERHDDILNITHVTIQEREFVSGSLCKSFSWYHEVFLTSCPKSKESPN